MRILFAVAAAAMTLSATAAFAEGEGRGDPFPFRAPIVTRFVTGGTLPTNGAEGVVQTANSLPAGFEDGTAAYSQFNSTQAFFQAQATKRAALLEMAEADRKAAAAHHAS